MNAGCTRYRTTSTDGRWQQQCPDGLPIVRGTAVGASFACSNGFAYTNVEMYAMQITFDAVSVTDAASIIGCTTGRVRQLLLDGEIRGKKLSQSENSPWLVSKVDAEKLAKNPASTGRPRKNS